MKLIILLGASGSIGTQTLDIIRKYPDDFKIAGLSVGHNLSLAKEIIKEFRPQCVCVRSLDDLILKNEFPNTKFFYGNAGLEELVKNDYKTKDCIVVNALVGSVGLRATITAIMASYDIALANKEVLVMAGEIIMPLAKKYKINIYPIDSEHSAIYQCLVGEEHENIKRIIITASGGAFRDLTKDELENVTIEEALNHPNWKMGAKITIDSATMMNKGFEVIEAHHLFNLPVEKIDTILHKESIIHSLVEYNDQQMKAVLANSDMRIPILYALNATSRLNSTFPALNLVEIGRLNFAYLSKERYPCLQFAYDAIKKGNIYPTILNAANEACVSLFLAKKIKFLQIENIIREYLYKEYPLSEPLNIDDIIALNEKIQKEIQLRFGGF